MTLLNDDNLRSPFLFGLLNTHHIHLDPREGPCFAQNLQVKTCGVDRSVTGLPSDEFLENEDDRIRRTIESLLSTWAEKVLKGWFQSARVRLSCPFVQDKQGLYLQPEV